MALQYLTGSVTQGSADAFAQGEIATALSGVSNFAFRLRELMFEISAPSTVAAAIIEFALSRRSKTSMPLISDRDVIAKYKYQNVLVTSGLVRAQLVERQVFAEDDELLIVEDPLYLILDSNATTLTLTCYARLGVTRESISAVDRLTLLTQSLD